MTINADETGFTPSKLRAELDTLAGLSDALEIVSEAADGKDANPGRGGRAVGALAREISQRLDSLYGDVHEALDDPRSFLGNQNEIEPRPRPLADRRRQ